MSSYYQRIEEQTIKNNAKKIADEMLAKFNEEINNTKTLYSYYNLSVENTNNSLELYNEYLEKNKELEKKVRDSNSDILTNDRKTFYETEAHEKLDLWNKIFKWIYMILAFLVFISLLFTEMPVTFLQKGIILAIIIIYPMIIGPILDFIYKKYTTIKQNLPKNVYNNL